MELSAIKKSLKEHGFWHCSGGKSLSHPHATEMWQFKTFDADGKIKYFITAYLYDGVVSRLPAGIAFDSAMYQPGRPDEWITAQLNGATVDRAIEFFADTYDKLGCEPDRHN